MREELTREKLAYYEQIKRKIEKKLAQAGDNSVITLEVGSMGHPTFFSGPLERKLLPNEVYLDVELDPAINMNAVWEGQNPGYLPINANAREMPFVNSNSVNEVVLSNVVNHPDIRDHSLRDIITELARVLKINGKIIITEDVSPDRDSIRFQFFDNQELKTGLTTKVGKSTLQIELYSEDEDLIRKYIPFGLDGDGSCKPFQLVLKKIGYDK